MADEKTKEQTGRTIEAVAETAKTNNRAGAEVARKGAYEAKQAVEAGADESKRMADAGAEVARKGTEETRRVVEAGAENAQRFAKTGAQVAQVGAQETKRVMDVASRQLASVTDQASHTAREVADRTGQNFDTVMQVATTAASGYQSVMSELVGQSQQAAQRYVDALNQAFRVRSPNDLLNIQSRYLQDSLNAMLTTSAKISQITADTANEAAGKLNQRKSA
jgi:hypothetical protein